MDKAGRHFNLLHQVLLRLRLKQAGFWEGIRGDGGRELIGHLGNQFKKALLQCGFVSADEPLKIVIHTIQQSPFPGNPGHQKT